MEQRTWTTIDPIRVYVTIGLYRPEDETSIIHELKHLVVVNEYPDTVIEATLRFRKLIAEKLEALSFHPTDTCWKPINPEDLFFMVYRTADPYEKPYLYSDNSPRNAEAIREVVERARYNSLSTWDRIKEDLRTWIHS